MLNSTQGPKCAGVVGRGHENSAVPRMPLKKLGCKFVALVTQPTSVHSYILLDGKFRQNRPHPFERTGDTALYQRPGLLDVKPENPADFFLPGFLSVLP